MDRRIKSFLITGILTMGISLIGLVIFSYSGLYIIHPIIYIMGELIGLGWTLTAVTAYKESKNK